MRQQCPAGFVCLVRSIGMAFIIRIHYFDVIFNNFRSNFSDYYSMTIFS